MLLIIGDQRMWNEELRELMTIGKTKSQKEEKIGVIRAYVENSRRVVAKGNSGLDFYRKKK